MSDQLYLLYVVFVFGFCVGVVFETIANRRPMKPVIQLSSMRAGHQHVQLSWHDRWSFSFGSEEYIILRKDGLFSKWREIATTRKLSMIDSTVVPGKQYRYKVCGNRMAIKGKSYQVSDPLEVTA